MKRICYLLFFLLLTGCAQEGVYVMESVPDQKVKKMEQDVIANPHDRQLQDELIVAYIQNKEYERAQSLLAKLLEHDSMDTTANYLMGLIYLRRNDIDNAQTYLEKVIAVNPGHIPSLFSLAVVDEKKNNLESARKRYQKILEINPDDGDAHYNLALLFDKKLFLFRKALYHYRKCVGLYAGNEDKRLIANLKKRIKELEILEKAD